MQNDKNKIQPIREAVRSKVDESTIDGYIERGLQGAAGGTVISPGWGTLIGAGAGLAERAFEDYRYNSFPAEKKMAWLAGDLQDLINNVIVPHIKLSDMGNQLSVYASEFKQYIDHYIRDKSMTPLEGNSLDGSATKLTNEPSPIEATGRPHAAQNSDPIPDAIFDFVAAGRVNRFVRVGSPEYNMKRESGLMGMLLKPIFTIGAIYAGGLVFNYLRGFIRGDDAKNIDYGLRESIAILKEMDSLATSLPIEFRAKFREGANKIAAIIQKVPQIIADSAKGATP